MCLPRGSSFYLRGATRGGAQLSPTTSAEGKTTLRRPLISLRVIERRNMKNHVAIPM